MHLILKLKTLWRNSIFRSSFIFSSSSMRAIWSNAQWSHDDFWMHACTRSSPTNLCCTLWIRFIKVKIILWDFTKCPIPSFQYLIFLEFSVQISQFNNTFRIFPIISLNTGNFDIAANSFWWDYGVNIEEIYFRNGILRKQEFEDIIRWTPNLKVLKIESNTIFATWKVLGNYHERLFQFENCYHISLARNNFIDRKIFDYVVSKAPNLREIDLSHCLAKMNGRDRTKILDHFIFYLKGKEFFFIIFLKEKYFFRLWINNKIN